MKTVSKEKADRKFDVFQIANSIKKQESEVSEASKIMNAYRKVEDIKVSNHAQKNDKKMVPKKAESQYANKVKQTLKQLNANRHKEQKQIKNIKIQRKPEKSSAERHLIASSCKKIFRVMGKIVEKNYQTAIAKLRAYTGDESQMQMIRNWKLRRIFSAWNYQSILTKIEKERLQKQTAEDNLRRIRMADDFRYFTLIKKSMTFWKNDTKRKIRKRAVEQEERRIQIAEILEEDKSHQVSNISPVQKNQQMQSKLRGFLDNLKHQIDRKEERLNTIKEKTENSDVNAHHQILEEQDSSSLREIGSEGQEDSHQQLESRNINQNEERRDENIQQQRRTNHLSNQELEQRRKQLAQKAKTRKEALEKLRKEKQSQKKRDEEERVRIEKEIKEEEKRVKQEQYKKFMKQKRELEEWEEKEKELNYQADQFNRLRVMKFYGWMQWKKLKSVLEENCESMNSVLTKIILSRKIKILIAGIEERGQKQLLALEEKIDKIYHRKLMMKSIFGFKEQRKEQIDLKIQFQARHEVHTLKIFFKNWMRVRPDLQVENFEWERPRVKRAECLYSMTLLHKALESLKINRDEQVQSRKIKEHKALIKGKVQFLVQEKPTIDYDQFL